MSIGEQPKDFKENVLCSGKHILLCDYEQDNLSDSKEFDYIKRNFCGNVFDIESFNNHKCSPDTIVYMCGDIKRIIDQINPTNISVMNIIKELSCNYNDTDTYQSISLGEVPINIHNIGVLFRNFFNSDQDRYNLITNEHLFQSLTESNKPTNAFRKGIYLTKVEKNTDQIQFKLLRCSTNLDGPTDNFRTTDNEIIDKVNNVRRYFFEGSYELNHVLAQTYHNTAIHNDTGNKEKKAKIKEHSDKTKDMPWNGLIVFCSFYKDYVNDKFNSEELKCTGSTTDPYDYCFNKNISVLTRLRFRLKKDAMDQNYEKRFDVTLYPNSVFMIPLSTNRLYTHEIVPSILPISRIPTRMGYVIRCSNTYAVFKDNQTHIIKGSESNGLEEPTEEGITRLKELYMKENATIEPIHYGDFNFSLNRGDYTEPII